MSYKVYGIKNCNTMKKAFDWLDRHSICYTFHDYKKEGISAEKLRLWCSQTGWEALLNRNGMTWRNLSDEEKIKITDEKSAIALMQLKTSIIKRPLIEKDHQILLLGFNETAFLNQFSG